MERSEEEIMDGLKNYRFKNLVPPLVALSLLKMSKKIKLFVASPNIDDNNLFSKIEHEEISRILAKKDVLFIKYARTTVPIPKLR